MTVNVPLLTKILDHVVAHPDEWDQTSWAAKNDCGTAYCIAGHAVVIAGDDLQWRTAEEGEWFAMQTVGNGPIPERAAELLGIPMERDERYDDALCWPIFLGDNTLRDIYREAHRLTDGEIPIPDVLPDGS